MFDYVRFKASLPVEIPSDWHAQWQTKDTPQQYLWIYEVTENGELWEHGWPIEDHPPRRLEDFHGDICFYDSHHITKEWFEFIARFTDGKLSRVWRVVEDDAVET